MIRSLVGCVVFGFVVVCGIAAAWSVHLRSLRGCFGEVDLALGADVVLYH